MKPVILVISSTLTLSKANPSATVTISDLIATFSFPFGPPLPYSTYPQSNMSDSLPTTKSDWKNAAIAKNIGHTQALAAGEAFISASKFELEHFLRLRVLYTAGRRPEDLVRSLGFPSERLEEMATSLEQDANAVFLKAFLKDTESLKKHWDMDKVKGSGIFAVAMELLHLIASRKLREMEQTEDTTHNKIELNPGKLRTTDFSQGDAKTVNSALVSLIMALALKLKFTGRVHRVRASFSVPNKDGDRDLYKAYVDGLILHLKEEKYAGFMVAARDYRGKNTPVRREISAQMAAFIYAQDIARGEVTVEEDTQEVTKGKGMIEKADDGQGNQKE